MYTLYIIYNVHTVQTNWWKPVQLYCVHTVQQNCSPMWKQSLLQGWAWATVGPQRGQLTASPATRWERPLSRVLLPFPCYQGFPALEGLGKQPLPGVGSVALVESQAKLPTVPCTSRLYWLADQWEDTNCAANQTWIPDRLNQTAGGTDPKISIKVEGVNAQEASCCSDVTVTKCLHWAGCLAVWWAIQNTGSLSGVNIFIKCLKKMKVITLKEWILN